MVKSNRGERPASKLHRALLAIGVFAVAAGVFLMISSGRILGERTADIATVSWIFGTGLISAYGPSWKASGRVLE